MAIAIFVALGLAVGVLYDLLLHRAVVALAGTSRLSVLTALTTGRFALAAAAFWIVAREAGAPALIAMLVGFTLAQIAARWTAGAR